MTETTHPPESRSPVVPTWVMVIIPILALAALLAVFAFTDPLALFKADLPPIEELSFERIRVLEDGFEVKLINGGPDPVTVAQVQVDEAYWAFSIEPSQTVPPLGSANLTISYPWVEAEVHEIRVITDTGLTFDGTVEIAVETPTPGAREFLAYGLVGIYVGIIPVGLGMLWYPLLTRAGRKWLGAILALTIGLLVFLLIDTVLEGFEVAETLPGVFQGQAMVLFAALLTWFILMAISARRGNRSPLYLAGLIALSIGLHNLGEGLAIGAAFALGEAALGSLLVVGFTLHNVTEGVGIVSPLLPLLSGKDGDPDIGTNNRPRLRTFLLLAALAGAPAILGTWIGGFAFSPLLAGLFLGIGAGAIWQVIVDVGRLLQRYAERVDEPLVSWQNLAGFTLGIAVMYFTAFLVSS
jgi:ZIP family zinc transporter